MKLYHKSVISTLSDEKLIKQWIDCCLIAGCLLNPTRKVILTKAYYYITHYPCDHFEKYCSDVYYEMLERNFPMVKQQIKKLENDLTARRYLNNEDLPWFWTINMGWTTPHDDELFEMWPKREACLRIGGNRNGI